MIDIKNPLIHVLLPFFLVASLYSTGQEMVAPEKLPASKLKKIALNAERYGDSYTALMYYREYASKRPDDYQVQYHLGELRETLRDYKGASEAYLDAYKINDKTAQALYDHIRTLKMTGQIDSAKTKYQELYDIIRKKRYKSTWRRVVRDEIASCDTALNLMADSLDVLIQNVGDGINGPHAEFSPIPAEDSTLIFGALKEDEIKYYRLDSMTTRRRLYISKKENGVWQKSQKWDVPFNEGKEHIVNGSYNHDKSLFIFTKCYENWKNEMTCELWAAEIENGQFKDITKLNEQINIEDAVITQPTLAYDQRKEQDILYYVSNQANGQGGMDIWYTYFDKRRNEWRKPRNLGRRINGEGDEVTPYYSQKEKKLYYSSSSFDGMGGLDIYSSRGELRRLARPVNVGYPINSSVDDFYFVLNDDRESGFFVSNRAGGYQMINETCCDDIYEFKRNDLIKIEMEGFVMLVEEKDYIIGDGDKLSRKSFNTNFLSDVQVDLILVEDGNEVLMDRFITKADGMFNIDFEPEKEYKVTLSKPGFFSNVIDVDTRNIHESKKMVQNIGLSEITSESIVVDNILYDFDSASLTADSRDKLEKGVLNTMKENPGIVVEISSHTDDKGDGAYNLDLSQKRAESVVNFLTERGIEKDRLVAKGYGETKPIAPNTNKDGSDNPEGRAKNRRTEFRILEQREVKEVDIYDEEGEE